MVDGPQKKNGQISVDNEVLSDIRVGLAELTGQFNTLNARLEERLERQADRQNRLDEDHSILNKRLADEVATAEKERATLADRVRQVEANWSKVVGLAIGSGLVGSGVAQAVLQALGG